jgi:hypothetical protein
MRLGRFPPSRPALGRPRSGESEEIRRRRHGGRPRLDGSTRRQAWQDLMLFWQERSAPSGRRGMSGKSGLGPDYKTRFDNLDDNDKYSSNPATHYLPGCLRRGPDAIWQ